MAAVTAVRCLVSHGTLCSATSLQVHPQTRLYGCVIYCLSISYASSFHFIILCSLRVLCSVLRRYRYCIACDICADHLGEAVGSVERHMCAHTHTPQEQSAECAVEPVRALSAADCRIRHVCSRARRARPCCKEESYVCSAIYVFVDVLHVRTSCCNIDLVFALHYSSFFRR